MSRAPTIPGEAGSTSRSTRRVIVSGAIGVFVEYYDYAAYGLVAGVVATVFFPPGAPNAALLLTYGVFAVSFVFRPIGGIILGQISDRAGRKAVMVFTLTLMAITTALIGLLPSYTAIGVAAPLLLLLLRLAQGFSAGGEMGSAMSFVGEWSPPRHRARNLAIIQFGSYMALFAGTVLAAGLNAALGADSMRDWGWRLVFLVAGPLGVIGFYIRSKLEDTPAFRRLLATGEVATSPLREMAGSSANRLAVLGATLVSVLNSAGYYVLFVYMPTYLRANLGFSVGEGLVITVVGIVVSLVLIPVVGALADRVGRRWLMIGSALATLVVALPAYSIMTAGSVLSAALGAALLAACFAPQPGIVHTVLVELFRTRVRTTGYSIGYNISTAVFGGAAPFIITWLIASTGVVSSPAIFMMASAVLTVVGLLTVPETRGAVLGD